MEDSQGDGRLADSAGPNESNWFKMVCKINDLFDQLITSEEDPWWWGR